MMLYLDHPSGGESGLAVLHATLHVPLREVFDLLTIDRVAAKIRLADEYLPPLTGGRPPKIAVAGLNPHAGENGLFGDEEITIIGPAVIQARAEGADVVGPIAADTLFVRALNGEFDAVIAMYHDQGHVALKTIGFDRAVNVTLGLPIVRTSVAHGTAFDIAWKGSGRDLEPDRGDPSRRPDRRRTPGVGDAAAGDPMTEAVVYLLRHGSTAANREVPYRLQGRVLDLPLDDAGNGQSRRRGTRMF